MNSAKRHPQIALLLSLLMPGLGQVYNGEISKGIFLFLAFAFSVPAFSWLALNGPGFSLWILIVLGVLCALGVYALSCIDAWRKASLIGESYVPGPHNKPYVYVSAFLFGYFFVLSTLASYTQSRLVECYRVASASMSPSLENGDYFFADKRVNSPGSKRKIRRGDIATFVYPNDRANIYVKRVIGLPGDLVEMNGTEVKVNGKSLSPSTGEELQGEKIVMERADSGKTYPVRWKADSAGSSLSLLVPNGHVFVLGDGREKSQDSRNFGPVPLTDIIAIARQVLVTTSPDGNVLLDRIGKSVDLNRP